MCLSKPKYPTTQTASPTVANTAPPPSATAETPIVNEGAKKSKSALAKRRGLSSLRINLNLGGSGGGGTGLNIPS